SVPVAHGAPALARTAFALGIHAPGLGGTAGPGGHALLRRRAAGLDERRQPLARVLAVAVLGAEALGVEYQHAVVGETAIALGEQAFAHGFGQRRRVGDVEAQLDRGRDLVDVLTAGTRRAHEALDDFGVRDVDGRRSRHGASLARRCAGAPGSVGKFDQADATVAGGDVREIVFLFPQAACERLLTPADRQQHRLAAPDPGKVRLRPQAFRQQLRPGL